MVPKEAFSANETENFVPGVQVFYTDLDATLIGHKTYTYDEATPALQLARKTGSIVGFVTSKTNDEVRAIQEKMIAAGDYDPQNPYVVENGGAIYLPEQTYPAELIEEALHILTKGNKEVLQKYKILSENGFNILRLGAPIDALRAALAAAVTAANHDRTGESTLAVTMSRDMSDEEFAKDTGLTREQAHMAKNRQYLEIFHPNVPAGEEDKVLQDLRQHLDPQYVLNIGGRFCQIMGANATKGSAVTVLNEILKKKYDNIWTIGLGDAKADFPFMEVCDQAFLIPNPHKVIPDAEIPAQLLPRLTRMQESAPLGWNTAVNMVLHDPRRKNALPTT